MKLCLVVQSPGNKMEGKALEIKLPQFLVGRDPQCHLRPASPLISKRHCALLQRDGKVFVRDFGSTNGTFINDQPVQGEVELHHADQLKIGPLLFSVHIEAGPPVNRPTPAPPTKAQAAKPAPKTTTPVPATSVTDKANQATAESPPPEKPAEKSAAETAAAAAASEDEDIAAMLLSLQDDGSGTSGLAGEVPEGSTIHDLSVAPETLGKEGEAAKDDKMAAAKAAQGNTSNAAKSILEKYMRRPRTQP
jgi:predicted component of type VI protein secretion system